MFNACGPDRRAMGTKKDTPASELVLEGVKVDVIKEVGTIWSLGIKGDFTRPTAVSLMDDVKQYLADSALYTPRQKEEAQWRIPVGDTSISDLSAEVERAAVSSHMNIGYKILREVAEGNADALDEITAERHAHACYIAQMGRMHDSRPFLSQTGHVGLCPMEAEPGDCIVILLGARVPYIPRAMSGSGYWKLIGESHVYGIMDGMFMIKQIDPAVEKFVLI
jgi:hypothetical protein